MKLAAYISKNLPNDLLVVTSVIGLVCSALYFIFDQPVYAVLSIASLVFYFLNDFIIFSKFLYLNKRKINYYSFKFNFSYCCVYVFRNTLY